MPSDHIPSPPPDTSERNREVLYIRLPTGLRERVDEYRDTMQRAAPAGVEVSRAAAIRTLLELALDAKEAA